MREILFKAKRLDNGEWVEGTPLFNPDMSKGKILSFAEYLGNDEISFYHYAVDPETICQYTGLIDKNGVKIFEGDICRFTDYDDESKQSMRSILWMNEFGAFWAKDDANDYYDVDEFFAGKCEVISNIHDEEE